MALARDGVKLRDARALITGLALLALAGLAAASLRRGDLIIYNHSPSLPIGFYLRTGGPIERGAIVSVQAARVAPVLAQERDFTGPDDRFLKRIAGVGGDEVCAQGDVISRNGEVVAQRRRRDSSGRILSAWSGCVALGADDLFLLGDTSDSFDGRYWGITSRDDIEGVWRPLR